MTKKEKCELTVGDINFLIRCLRTIENGLILPDEDDEYLPDMILKLKKLKGDEY